MLFNRFSLSRPITFTLLLLLTALLCVGVTPVHAFLSPSAPSASSCLGALPCNTVLLANAALVQEGKILYDAGRFEAAIAPLKQAVEAYRTKGDALRQAIALSNLALTYQHLGRWSEAQQAITDSVTLLSQPQTQSPQAQPFLAQALDIQGNLQLELGQTETAIATWQRSESIYNQLQDVNGIAQSQMNQAQGLRVLGYYRRALAILTGLHQTLRDQPDSITKVMQLRSLGNTLRLVGDLDQSQTVLQQGLKLAKQLLPSPTVDQTMSALWSDLGNTARAQDDLQTAISFYQTAANTASTVLGKLQAQINLFDGYIDNQQSASASALLPEIQAQLKTLPLNQDSLYTQIHLAQSLLKLTNQTSQPEGTHQPAFNVTVPAKLLAASIQQARTLGTRRAEAYALGSLGNAYEQVGQRNEAQALTRQALELAQDLNAADLAYRWYWQLGRLLKQEGKTEAAIAAYDAAITELQFLRNDLVAVNRDVQFSFRKSVEPIYRESVELLVQGGQPTEQNLDKARQRIEALQLAELDNFFREACLDARTILLDRVVDQDNPTAAVIYPIILPNQLTVIVKIPQRPLHQHTITVAQTDVESLLQEFQQNLTELDAAAKIRIPSQQVYQWLIAPIKPDLERQGVNTLVFVLDGALRSIPMAGLYDGEHYLVENYAIALSVGLQLLPPKPLATEHLSVLAAGLIEPPPQFQDQFSPLPEIQTEFDLISESGVPNQQLLNQAFTSQALESKVSSTNFNVVHLATHGQFSSQAKDTFILAADGPINVTQFDSLLRKRNQLQQANAIELLVLSACQTAEGDDRATLGLAGVAVKAGARSTLASLWQIDDRSTALLIGEFYRELVQNKVTKAEALRRAQVTLFTKYPNYNRLSYWAAYVLIGNWL